MFWTVWDSSSPSQQRRFAITLAHRGTECSCSRIGYGQWHMCCSHFLIATTCVTLTVRDTFVGLADRQLPAVPLVYLIHIFFPSATEIGTEARADQSGRVAARLLPWTACDWGRAEKRESTSGCVGEQWDGTSCSLRVWRCLQWA